MRHLLLAAAAAMVLPASAQAAGFVNGSFEDAAVNPGGGFVTLGEGSTAIDGWVVTATNIDYIGTYWQAADGVRSIDLNGNFAGGIQQSFDTRQGQRYKVTFSLAGNPEGGSAVKVMSTVANGNRPAEYEFDTTGKTVSNMGWTEFSYNFVAGGPRTTLAFTSAGGGAFGAALDLVSVAAVPEPATWALMILGFGAVGGAMRRRTKAAVRFA